MTWVKVCGLRQQGDVEAAVNAGADAVGFVLSEGSPRQVSVQRAATLMEGVFSDFGCRPLFLPGYQEFTLSRKS